MEVKSSMRFARISPRKVGDLAKIIRGKGVPAALDAMKFSHRKGAFLLLKALTSAVANAENNNELSAEDMVVRSVAVEYGPSMRRFKARARGMASPIRKRMCHVKIVLAETGRNENDQAQAAKGEK